MRIALPGAMVPVVIRWGGDKKECDGEHGQYAVRQLKTGDLALYLADRERFEKIFGSAPKYEQEGLMSILGLADAIEARSLPKLKRALKHYWIYLGTSMSKGDVSPDLGRVPLELVDMQLRMPGFKALEQLREQFNMHLSVGRVYPIVFWSDTDQRLVFAIQCTEISTALYLLAIERVGIGELGQCKGCHGVLIRDRPNKQFCDDRCRARHNMRQLRARQAAQKAKRKRGNRQRRAVRQKAS